MQNYEKKSTISYSDRKNIFKKTKID